MSKQEQASATPSSEQQAHELLPSLILASASPRRKMLLSELGLPFQIIASNEAEIIEPGRRPEEQAVLLAEQKARAIARNLSHGYVLGADTIVVLDEEILGKPSDALEAERMLRKLSGRAHKVVTGVSLVDAATANVQSMSVLSAVHFRLLSDEEIVAYVATGEPLDRAGAYAIQELGGALIEKFEGCFNNIVGLPLCAVAALCQEAGILIPPGWEGCRLPDGALCPNSPSPTAR